MENNFAVFILSHGRANNIRTLKSLQAGGYTGKVYIVIDNEDKTSAEYYKLHGDKVLMFDKKEMAKYTDIADNFEKLNVVVHARNANFFLAKRLGLKYFLQLDDDYTSFLYRNIEGGKNIKNLDKVFEYFVEFLATTPIKSVAFSQGGDHIGGYDDTRRIKRKVMNSFFCSVDKPFTFIGRINEDVNTYVLLGSRGDIFFTINNIQLNQFLTQSNKGGLTDIYLHQGTYVKSFYTVIFHPSSVSISTMGRGNRRLHHNISWDNTTPMIVDERWKKGEPITEWPEEQKYIPDTVFIPRQETKEEVTAVLDTYDAPVIEEAEAQEKMKKELVKRFSGCESAGKLLYEPAPEIKLDPNAEYVVSYSYELKLSEGWDKSFRVKGSLKTCREFIEIWQKNYG